MCALRTEPLRWFSSSCRILAGERELATLSLSTFRHRGAFELDGEAYSILPEGFWRSSAVLRKGASVLARAEKTSPFRRRFQITSAGHRLLLESRSWWGKHYVLYLGQQVVGEVRARGWSGRHLDLDLPEEMPLFLKIFVAYLVLWQLKRDQAAAASGG